MAVPKVYFLEEPDEHLIVLLSFSRFERVDSSQESDLIFYPRLVRPEKRNISLDLSSYVGKSTRENAGKPVIVFVFNDYEGIVRCGPNPVIVYRTGVSRFWKLPNEFILPFLWIIEPGELKIGAPREKPVVGFCGTLFGRKSRKTTLDFFRADHNFQCEFVIRDRFAGGGGPQDRLVIEFFENMDKSDFVVCDRGRGNWTIRLYEALSRGKVPVLYDTGSSLVTIRDGSWNDTIIVARTREALSAKMMQVWAGDFVARQRDCRALWENNLSVRGFADVFSADIAALVLRIKDGRKVYEYTFIQKIHFLMRYLMHFPSVRLRKANR